MNRIIHFSLLHSALLLVSASLSAEVVVSNVRAEQREGTNLVDIYYDVTALTPTVTVNLAIRDRLEASDVRAPVGSATRHIGENVLVGADRHIVWDAGEDWPWRATYDMQFDVTAQIVEPIIDLAGDLAFGDVDVVLPSARTLTIKNIGYGPLVVTEIIYPDAVFTGGFADTIPAGESRDVTVTFAPTEGRLYSGNLTVASNAVTGVHTRAVSGKGLTPVIFLSGDLAFGNVLVGQSAVRTLTAENTGKGVLMITTITCPEGFSADWSGEIEPGDSREIEVTFTPTKQESYSGDIEVASNAITGIHSLPVNGKSPKSVAMVLVHGGTLSMSMGTRSVDTFYIDRYEVTWGMWKAVRKWGEGNDYEWTSAANYRWADHEPSGCMDDHPVHGVNWFDALKWCNAKSEIKGLTPVYTVGGEVYRSGELGGFGENWSWVETGGVEQNLSANGYRLPLEAEWEFAARGGNQTNGYTYAGSDDLNAVGWYRDNSSWAECDLSFGRGTWPVGQKAANELGLYDMSGNVWEWCWDLHGQHNRLLRGGSWSEYPSACSVSGSRYPSSPDNRWFGNHGFRLARSSGN